MRTPIQTLIVFLNMIMSSLILSQNKNESTTENIHYCNLMMSQLELLLSYIEDLLDLR